MNNIEDKDFITCNIVEEERYRDIVNRLLKKISKSLEKSLGYYGSSTIIEDKINGHVATKDGYTILSNMKFENPIACTIYDIIKKISFNLVQTVGDGSTSSVVIAQNLFSSINDSLKNGNLKSYSPKEIFDCLKKIEKELTDKINEVAIPITDDNFEVIRKIAEVSNNNDPKVGKNIYDIYKVIKNEGFIYLENSSDSNDSYEFLSGIEFGSGMISDDFSNNKNFPECIFKEPYIFMCNDRLDSTDLNLLVDVIGNLVARHTRPVVIIAKSFSAEFVSCWIINKKQNPNINICLVDFNFANSNQSSIFQDIALYTGATIYDKNSFGEEEIKKNFYTMMGSCDEMKITNKTTRIIGRKCSNEELKERIEYIDETIKTLKKQNDPSLDYRIFQLETRKANLNSTIVKYYVGGDTEIEKNNRKYLIEDSVFACRAALNSGYVSGGNLTIPKIIDKIEKNDYIDFSELEISLYNLIANAFKSCYKAVLMNKFNDEEKVDRLINNCIDDNMIYNIKNDTYEEDYNTDIVNSALTEIEIMKAVFSIIGILVTSNQYIGRSF